MNNRIMFDRLLKMYEMAIWDNEGRMYMPVHGYDGQIYVYVRAEEALDIWNDDMALESALEY